MKSLFFASLIALASAHATWQQLWVGSQDMDTQCTHIVGSNSPVTSVGSAQMRCNTVSSRAKQKCSIPAGSKVTVEIHQQPNQRSCSNEAIGGNHYGPVMVYMSKVSDALSADGSTPFFKIFEAGLLDPNSNPQKWANEVVNKGCGKQEFTIPSNIAPGDYLLRAETIALHSAGQSGGAQFYMSCYAVTISGGGSANPSGVTFPGAYKASDPGILINIWYPLPKTYTIPGPRPYTG